MWLPELHRAITRHCFWTVSTCLVGRCDNQSCIALSQGTEDTVCIPSSQALLLLMLLIPWCNLICSELVHSILLFKVSLIWEVLLMSADYSYWVILMSADYRVHLHVFKKMQLQSSKSCMCVTSAEKFKKRQSWKMWPVFLYFANQPLSSLYREVWRNGKGDRVKERACEWVAHELCIVKKNKAQKWKHIFKKKTISLEH